MTLISKHKLRNDVSERTFELFVQTILNNKGKIAAKNFIDGFFTPTEKIVFAKRMAIYVMLAKGNNYESIRETLKVSPPTIARASTQLNYSHELDKIINAILTKDAFKIILNELESMFELPGKGKSFENAARAKRSREQNIHKLKEEF